MEEIVAILRQIEQHLAVIASYAEHLRVEKTGEKIHEVRDYVISTTSRGDRVLYLYSTHPGLQYRVCAVYQERFHELPFAVPDDARVWDGEAAPSREGAARKGYLYSAPAPFRVSLLPTGAVTDAGLPVYRFHRVVDAEPVQPVQSAQSAQAPRQAQPSQPSQPSQPVQPAQSAQPDFAEAVRKASRMVAGEPDRQAMESFYRDRLLALFPDKPLLPAALAYMVFRKRLNEIGARDFAALIRALDGADDEVRASIRSYIAAHRDEVDMIKAAIGR